MAFHELLCRHATRAGAGDPPRPFILAASGESNSSKHERLGEQLRWAQANGIIVEALDFLRSLRSDQWNQSTTNNWHKPSYWEFSEQEDESSTQTASTNQIDSRGVPVARAGVVSGNESVKDEGSSSLSRQASGEDRTAHTLSVSGLKAQDWFAMAKWAKEKNYLSSWQRKFAFDLGVRVNRGIEISDKQRPHAEQLLEEATTLGYEVSG
jgi:hypothetical protein